MLDRVRAARRPGRTALLLGALLALVISSLPAASASSGRAAPGVAPGFQGESGGLPNVDRRSGQVQPTSRQRSLVAGKGAKARWNAFGTPRSLVRHGAALAGATAGSPATAARGWLRANRELFRLSEQGVANLELLHQARIGKATRSPSASASAGCPPPTTAWSPSPC
jgi:extracellular elastinolytic metalloproteinase